MKEVQSNRSDETRKKMSEAQKGSKRSPETKAKMAASRKAYIEKRKLEGTWSWPPKKIVTE